MKIVSIHSAPRSGSTWLQAILESHPNITTRYQPLFSYAFKNRINENSTSIELNNFIKELYDSEDEFVNMKSAYHKDINNKLPEYEKSDITSIAMKNVHHHYLIETFIKLCPNIKIIGLIRNPCGTINSIINNKHEYKEEWKGTNEWLTGERKNISKEYYFGYQKWKEVVDIFEEIKREYPNNIYIIQYENLIDNPNVELINLFEYLEIDVHVNIFNFVEESHNKNNITKSVTSVYKNKTVKDKWKNILNNEIIEYIENDIKNSKYKQYYI